MFNKRTNGPSTMRHIPTNITTRTADPSVRWSQLLNTGSKVAVIGILSTGSCRVNLIKQNAFAARCTVLYCTQHTLEIDSHTSTAILQSTNRSLQLGGCNCRYPIKSIFCNTASILHAIYASTHRKKTLTIQTVKFYCLESLPCQYMPPPGF
jgi:hypothetical protein